MSGELVPSPEAIGLPGLLPGGEDLSATDRAALARAVAQLDRSSFATRISGLFGHQIEAMGRVMPARFASAAAKGATLALRAALRVALTSLHGERKAASPRLHLAIGALSGAAGGAFGLATLPFELPFSTVVMLRSIADIARAEGEDLADPEAALACLQVFALGGQQSASASEQAILEGGYFAVRGLLAKTVNEAARYLVQRGMAEGGAPVLMRLVSLIATRFGMVVTQKAMAQALPILGAAGGAAINVAFTQHFQDVARGHFTVRRLERTYGAEVVRAAYEELRTGKTGRSEAAGQAA